MLVKPTPQQLAWQEAELTMFLHFGVNTFRVKFMTYVMKI